MNIRTLMLSLCVLLFASPAWAKPRIVISIAQSKEVVETKSGARTTRMTPTDTASPGDVVEYVLSYANQGDELAKDAVVDDQIPKGTTYIANSASAEGAELTFSSDGGKTFAKPVKLTYEFRSPSGAVEKRVATPAEYTHIRWTIKQVPPGGTGKVAFRVKVN
jgi:uncharacterized repeat protein (TIGR01451 family)